MKHKLLFILLLAFLIASCSNSESNKGKSHFTIEGQTSDGFKDGTYCAELDFNSADGLSEKSLILKVRIVDNLLNKIIWPKGEEPIDDYFLNVTFNENGLAEFTSSKANDYKIQLINEGCEEEPEPVAENNIPGQITAEECLSDMKLSQSEMNRLYQELNLQPGELISITSCDNLHEVARSVQSLIKAEKHERKVPVPAVEKTLGEIVYHAKETFKTDDFEQYLIVSLDNRFYLIGIRNARKCPTGYIDFDPNSSSYQDVGLTDDADDDFLDSFRGRVLKSGGSVAQYKRWIAEQ